MPNNSGSIDIIASQQSVNDVPSPQLPSRLEVSAHSDSYVAANLVFDETYHDVINVELRKQQKFIFNLILNEINVDKKDWISLLNYKACILCRGKINIRQDTLISKYSWDLDFMEKNDTKAEYAQESLFNDLQNNWESVQEYDLKVYLTKLLINARMYFPLVFVFSMFFLFFCCRIVVFVFFALECFYTLCYLYGLCCNWKY